MYNDTQIGELFKQYPLLSNISPDSVSFVKHIALAVIEDDLAQAVDEILKLSESEIPEEHAESYLVLAQNVCAATEYAEGWILFKKNYARFLIDRGRADDATIVLAELAELLPEDDELKDMQESVKEKPAPHRAESRSGIDNPDIAPSYTHSTKGLPLMNNGIDRRFYELMQSIKNSGSVDSLTSEIVNRFDKLPDNVKNWYHSRFGRTGEFKVLPLAERRAGTLFTHAEEIIWFYERLANYRSRYTLYAFVHNWAMWGDLLGRVGKIRDDIYKEYLDFDVLTFSKDEVYADCGGFIGDSLADYLNEVGLDNYKKIYVYEFDKENCTAIRNLIGQNRLKNIVLRSKAVGLPGILRYTPVAPGADRSGNSLSDSGKVEVEVVSLDDDIKEQLTYIKMDIEGSEYDAILGAKRHIQEGYPKLAICLYHKPNDIWEIPRLIDAIAPKYKFYLTFCGFAMDTVGMAMLAVCDK